MNERDISEKYNEPISGLVAAWGYGAAGYGDMHARAIKWLSNFKDYEIEDALKIMCQIEVIQPANIQSAIHNLARAIQAKIIARPIVIASLEGSPSSSGSQFLHMLERELNLVDCKVISGDIEKIVDENKIVILVDDFVGSGGEAIGTWNKIKHKDSLVYYCPILCCSDGKGNIESERCFTGFMPQRILEEQDKAFSQESRFFPNPDERERLKKLASKYGEMIYPGHSLGYNNAQAMIAWSTTGQAPNNSLPIIWGGRRNEAKIPWEPLFERIVSNTKVKKSQISSGTFDRNNAPRTRGAQAQPITTEEIISQADNAISMHRAGDISGYRSFISNSKLTNKLKRAALFEKLRDLAQVDLDLSLQTRNARAVFDYAQSCLVLCEIDDAISIIHRKLFSDPKLETYSVKDKAAFMRTYAEVLTAAGRGDLSANVLESILNSGLVSKLQHNTLSHMLSILGASYLSIGNLGDAYDIAQENHDEQCLTKNQFASAISGIHLGIALLAKSEAGAAMLFFEKAVIALKGFDLRGCAWAELYCHICALRLGEARTNHLDSAMDFYSKVNHSSKELLKLMQEARTAGIGWHHSYDGVINKISALVVRGEVRPHNIDLAEKYCNAFIAAPVYPGANAIDHRVSRGEFRQSSILTSSFLRSLNEIAKNEYLEKIISTERFYLRPFYNKLIRIQTDERPDLVKKIIFPKLEEISVTTDSFRVYYARLLEYHNFINEANYLIESMENKGSFQYLNNKANILAHQLSTLNEALELYEMAVHATQDDQDKSIAYHNQARAILLKQVKSKYVFAETLCRLSINCRRNEAFLAPVQTLLLIRIDRESQSKTADILAEHQKEFRMPLGYLKKTINNIKNKTKYIEAEKYLREIN